MCIVSKKLYQRSIPKSQILGHTYEYSRLLDPTTLFVVGGKSMQVQAELEQRSIEAAEALVDIGQEGFCIFDVGKDSETFEAP